MPIYEFNCLSCGSRFESIMSFEDISKAHCDNCGSANIEKLLSTIRCINPDDQLRKSSLAGIKKKLKKQGYNMSNL